jgi:isoleucyl-tRNA synthetase
MSIDFPKEEERILARWKEIGAFLRQVELVRTFCWRVQE